MDVRLATAVLCISFLSVACTPGAPSDAIARAAVEEQIQASEVGNDCNGHVVEFKKLDGLASKRDGVPRYRYEFEATLECTRAGFPEVDLDPYPGRMEAGQRGSWKSYRIFEKTEGGWRLASH